MKYIFGKCNVELKYELGNRFTNYIRHNEKVEFIKGLREISATSRTYKIINTSCNRDTVQPAVAKISDMCPQNYVISHHLSLLEAKTIADIVWENYEYYKYIVK
jgi:hypothetical protein